MVGSLGVLGNIISIIVLTSTEMRNSFNLLLSCLAFIDILFIIIAVLDYSLARGNIEQDGSSLESSSYLNVSLRYTGP